MKKRNQAYYKKTGMSSRNSGRTYAQLSAFEEGGIEEFEFRAVIDPDDEQDVPVHARACL